MDPNHSPGSPQPGGTDWSRMNQWLLWLGLAAAVAWLVFRHGAHLVELLPFLLILACPLMHLFGHGHGKSHSSHGDKQ
jgi:hypothetical protein